MSVDFFPTLVEMAGLPPCTEDLSGVSLGPVLREPPTAGAGQGRKCASSARALFSPAAELSYASDH